MNTEPAAAADDETALSVTLMAPVSWLQSALPAAAEAGLAAVRALATAVSLAERPPGINEEALGVELEIARLHQKTQLLIELLALALARDVTRPPPRALQLSAAACSWQAAQAVAVGSIGAVAIWLHPAAPEPMSWPAEIVECQPAPDGNCRLQARLLPLGEAATAALERHVFQLHRRAVAEARSLRS